MTQHHGLAQLGTMPGPLANSLAMGERGFFHCDCGFKSESTKATEQEALVFAIREREAHKSAVIARGERWIGKALHISANGTVAPA